MGRPGYADLVYEQSLEDHFVVVVWHAVALVSFQDDKFTFIEGVKGLGDVCFRRPEDV